VPTRSLDRSRSTPDCSQEELLAAFAEPIRELEERGRGIFHIHPEDDPVFRIEVERGDMINVPRGTRHWFDLCEDRDIRAIRLFQDLSGWTPHYTGSGADEGFQPLCFGPQYLPPMPGL
jgi:cupin superfamily acireductone dioxygenase involved in methionine salvage